MNKTAEQIHNDFQDKFVKIKKTNGEKIIGTILLTAGLERAGNLVPNSSFLQVDAITDIDAYKKDARNYQPEYVVIHPDDIDSIREYDILNSPVRMSYTDYQNILSENNPMFVLEIIDEIKDGKQYLVIHEGTKYKIMVDNEDHLMLTPEL